MYFCGKQLYMNLHDLPESAAIYQINANTFRRVQFFLTDNVIPHDPLIEKVIVRCGGTIVQCVEIAHWVVVVCCSNNTENQQHTDVEEENDYKLIHSDYIYQQLWSVFCANHFRKSISGLISATDFHPSKYCPPAQSFDDWKDNSHYSSQVKVMRANNVFDSMVYSDHRELSKKLAESFQRITSTFYMDDDGTPQMKSLVIEEVLNEIFPSDEYSILRNVLIHAFNRDRVTGEVDLAVCSNRKTNLAIRLIVHVKRVDHAFHQCIGQLMTAHDFNIGVDPTENRTLLCLTDGLVWRIFQAVYASDGNLTIAFSDEMKLGSFSTSRFVKGKSFEKIIGIMRSLSQELDHPSSSP